MEGRKERGEKRERKGGGKGGLLASLLAVGTLAAPLRAVSPQPFFLIIPETCLRYSILAPLGQRGAGMEPSLI